MAKKTFVLDTNVILHDYNCLNYFEENDLVIPITVIEELDKFKKGNDQINFNARFFVRELDKLSAGKNIFDKGVSLGSKKGKLKVSVEPVMPEEIKKVLSIEKPDHKILAVAYNLSKRKRNPVILVSKDINLRMKARSFGVLAEDYETDKVESIDTLYSGKELIDNVPNDLIETLYSDSPHFPVEKLKELGVDPKNNQFFILKNNNSSVLAYYNPFLLRVERVEKRDVYGIRPRNAEQTFALHALLNPEIQLTALLGKAGTGKTLLALAASLSQGKMFKQIFIARPVVPLGNKDIGYLPGDVKSKISPYMQPLHDNLKVIQNQYSENDEHFKKIDQWLESGKINVAPLAYIRGRTLSQICFIIDEAQNLTPHEIKTIITRAGEKTKIILTGDPFQIDTPYLDSESNGLSYLIAKLSGQKIFSTIRLEKGERSELAELASNLL